MEGQSIRQKEKHEADDKRESTRWQRRIGEIIIDRHTDDTNNDKTTKQGKIKEKAYTKNSRKNARNSTRGKKRDCGNENKTQNKRGKQER